MTDGNDGAQRTGCGADELLSAVVEARDSNSVESATSEGADAPSGDRERNDSAPRPKKRARSSHRVAKQHASLLVAGSINGGISTMTSSSSLVTHAKSPQYFRVGCLKERHASWSDLSLYLTYYMHTTQTRIVASETVSFSQQNAVLRATQSSEHEAMTAPVPSSRVSRSSRERLFPEGSDPYSRTFVCRGPYQERQNEEEQRVECPFRFMAHVVRERDAWRILVPSARQHCFHNHPIVGGLRVPRSVVTNIRYVARGCLHLPLCDVRYNVVVASDSCNYVCMCMMLICNVWFAELSGHRRSNLQRDGELAKRCYTRRICPESSMVIVVVGAFRTVTSRSQSQITR